MSRDKHENLGGIGAIANEYTPQGQNAKTAGDALRLGEKKVQELVKDYANCTNEQVGGRVAEIWHKSTFEADAALKDRHDLDVLLGPRGGIKAKGSADLTVLKIGVKVEEAGLKYCKSAVESTFEQSNVFDCGRQKISPSDQINRIKELSTSRANSGTLKSLQYSDTAKNVTDKLSYENVQSKPLSKSDSVNLVANPNRFEQEVLQVEVGQAAKGGALLGGGLGFGVSMIANIASCANGKKDTGEAVIDVMVNTAKGTIQGGTIGAGGAAIRNQLIKSGATGLAKGPFPVVAAASVFEAGCNIAGDLVDLCDGKIDGGEFVAGTIVHTGKAAVKGGTSWGGAELGAAVGSVLGPVGTVIGGLCGGLLGYMFGSGIVD